MQTIVCRIGHQHYSANDSCDTYENILEMVLNMEEAKQLVGQYNLKLMRHSIKASTRYNVCYKVSNDLISHPFLYLFCAV